MGTIPDPKSLEEFFGRGAYSRDKKVSRFEEALQKLQGGGVLIFDEASNMGSNNKEFKDAMFKQFYDLLEEGKYHSEVTGITYDLSNFVFWFNGNDGEKLFPPGTSEQMAEKIWKSESISDRVSHTLHNAGVPLAFLGRIGILLLSRPLTRANNVEIGQVKFLDPTIEKFQKANRVQVTYDPEFPAQLSKSFYTSLKGARSLRNVVDQKINSALGLAIFQAKKQLGTAKNLTLNLSLHDNDSPLPYAVENEPERKVELEIKVTSKDGKSTTLVRDLTSAANAAPKPSMESLRSTTYHEAGHLVANDPKKTGMVTDYITVWRSKMPDGNTALGYASFRPIDQDEYADRESAIGRIARGMGGQLGQMMSGATSSEGWSDDLKKIRQDLSRHLIQNGMVGELVGASVDKDGNPILSGAQQAVYDREAQKMLREAFELAQTRLKENWGWVKAIAEHILEKGDIHENEINQLKTEAPSSTDYHAVSADELLGRFIADAIPPAHPALAHSETVSPNVKRDIAKSREKFINCLNLNIFR
jgi:hypothetical protein